MEQPNRSEENFKPAKLSTPTTPAKSRSRPRRKVTSSSAAANNNNSSSEKNSNNINLSSSLNSMSSVVFTNTDDEVFDEIDALNPHDRREGGNLVSITPSQSAASSLMMQSHAAASLAASGSAARSNLSSSYTAYASQFSKSCSSVSSSIQTSQQQQHFVPTDYETLMNKTKDGSLAELLRSYEESSSSLLPKNDPLKLSNILELQDSATSTNISEEALEYARNSSHNNQHDRSSVVGGTPISQMSLQEQATLLQRSNRSLFADEDHHEVKILSSVDWNSLTKSCKCAKNAFRDSDFSGNVVVKNILSPPREEDPQSTSLELSSIVSEGMKKPKIGSDFRDDVERYRSGRIFRQELQDAAVKSEANEDEDHQRLGLHLSLVAIILGTRPTVSRGHVPASVEKDQHIIQILAARVLCNIVTDNPVSSEIVLMDVPFGPNNEETERRMSMPLFNGDPSNGIDIVLCWSDLVAATSKLYSTDPEREALAAVAAALHNLLASLETRDSLIELNNELKRRSKLRNKRTRAILLRRQSSHMYSNSSDDDSSASKPLDAGFDAVYNRQLMNALLRNILPARAVIMGSQYALKGNYGRPKFQAPMDTKDQSESLGDSSDSATEWVSLIIERMASRGLLPQMYQSAGGPKGKSVTPEQVVLLSCVRQAIDDYHSARTQNGEVGEFGRRRLSIAAKSAGVTTLSRPHPLWGRVNEEFSDRNDEFNSNKKPQVQNNSSSRVVPILLFLANEAARLYTHTKSIHENPSEMLYDGELGCTLRVIEDIRDIIGQCLGRHNANISEKNKQCSLPEARTVLGRETLIITHCLFDLAQLLDSTLARNIGRNARDLYLTPEEQRSAIVMVRLIGNMAYQCRYNQDMLRIIHIPFSEQSSSTNSLKRVGLHVILSTTSLAPTCLSLREWCIVAIRNAVDGNEANAEAVRLLEAQNTIENTPELQRMGLKVKLDKGKVSVQKRDGFS
eukprot:scaffold10557_cov72-Cyclotella_meneghiniana.AAC.2